MNYYRPVKCRLKAADVGVAILKEFAMRLVTRSDFDGLICAVLLKHVGKIDSIKFVHPKDLQDGKFAVSADDVLTNVPFVHGCGLWFDHHATEVERVVGKIPFQGECRLAPSAARVVYDYFGGRQGGLRSVQPGRNPSTDRLEPAFIRDGFQDWTRPVQRLPHQQL
jgi:hypothetical protein